MNELLKTLLTISKTASVMILVVMGVRAIFAKRMNPVVIAALWAVVLIRLCVPITLESPVHVGDLIPETPVAMEETVEAEVPTVNIPQANTAVNHTDIPTMVNNTIPPQTEVVAQRKVVDMTQPSVWQRMVGIAEGISLWNMLTAVWILGAVVVLGNTVLQGVKFKCRLLKCERVTDGEIRHMVNALRRQLGIKRHVEVVECDDIGTPAVFGFFRPVVILPAKYAHSMGINGVRCILLHEMCHIKRRDILKSYVWLIAKALHWFNPLVWLAFRKAKDDIELCCDQMVMAQMSKDKQYEYTQSLIDVIRIAQQKSAFTPTVSLFERKAQLVERVRRMVKPHKRSRGAAAVSMMIVVIMIVVCFTTACQPAEKVDEPTMPEPTEKIAQEEPEKKTPEAEVVVSEQLQEEVKEPLAKYSVTDHWTDSVEREDSIIKLNIDADIVMPEVERLYTYKVNPAGDLSQDMVDRIMKLLFEDTPVYEWTEPNKGLWQKRLNTLEPVYQSMLDGTFDFTCFMDGKGLIGSIEKEMNLLTDRIEEAPEATDPVPLNTSFMPNEVGIKSFRGEADLGRDNMASIIVHSWKDGTEVQFRNEGCYWMEERAPFELPIGNLTISSEDAVSTAHTMLANLGLDDDFALYSNHVAERHVDYYIPHSNQYAHVLVYTRVIDGVKASPNYPYTGNMQKMLNTTVYSPEQIIITIDDDGVREFEWQNVLTLTSTLSKDKLMPFNEMQKVIEEQAFQLHEVTVEQLKAGEVGIKGLRNEAYIFNIDAIHLEYAKLPYNGDIEDMRLVPVWNVYGTTDWRFSKVENGERVKDSCVDTKSEVILTINAIDGSVI